MDARHTLLSLKNLTKNRKSVRLSKVATHLKGPLEPFFIGLLSFPFLLFITVPGISLVLAIIIAINGVRISEQKPVYLPKFLGKIKISSSIIEKAIQVCMKHFLPHPKGYRRASSKSKSMLFLSWLSGWIICFSGVLLCLPLPPGTSIPPAIALILVSIGLYRQVLGWVITGGLVFILCMGTLVLFLSWSALRIYHDWPMWSQHFYGSS